MTGKVWTAINHNGTALTAKPVSKADAKKEAAEYTGATGNASTVVLWNEDEHRLKSF